MLDKFDFSEMKRNAIATHFTVLMMEQKTSNQLWEMNLKLLTYDIFAKQLMGTSSEEAIKHIRKSVSDTIVEGDDELYVLAIKELSELYDSETH